MASRCAVEIGSPARRAISVSECSLPSVNVIRIEVILLVTERPDSVEFPAIPSLPSSPGRSPPSDWCHVDTSRCG